MSESLPEDIIQEKAIEAISKLSATIQLIQSLKTMYIMQIGGDRSLIEDHDSIFSRLERLSNSIQECSIDLMDINEEFQQALILSREDGKSN